MGAGYWTPYFTGLDSPKKLMLFLQHRVLFLVQAQAFQCRAILAPSLNSMSGTVLQGQPWTAKSILYTPWGRKGKQVFKKLVQDRSYLNSLCCTSLLRYMVPEAHSLFSMLCDFFSFLQLISKSSPWLGISSLLIWLPTIIQMTALGNHFLWCFPWPNQQTLLIV